MRHQVFFSVYCSTVLALFSLADGARRLEDVPPKRIGIVASVSISHLQWISIGAD